MQSVATTIRNLEIDGSNIELFSLLRAKDELNFSPSVNIPDTVFIKAGKPTLWYFTSKDGKVKRKHKQNMSVKQIDEAFTKHTYGYDVVATFISTPHGIELDASYNKGISDTTIQYLDYEGLKNILYSHDNNLFGILQRFIEPKTTKNELIRAAWSPKICLLERAENIHDLHDSKFGMYERCVTFEGPQYFYNLQPLRGPILSGLLHKLCEGITSHISEVTYNQIQIVRLVLNFKVDSRDKIWLLQSTSIRCTPRSLVSADPQSGADIFSESNIRPMNLDNVMKLPSSISLNAKPSAFSITGSKSRCCISCGTDTMLDRRFNVTYKAIIKQYEHFILQCQNKLTDIESFKNLNWPLDSKLSKISYQGVGLGCIQIMHDEYISNIRNRTIPFKYTFDVIIPPILQYLYPGLNHQVMLSALKDPNFLFKTIQVCENCCLIYSEFTSKLLKCDDNVKKLISQDEISPPSNDKTIQVNNNHIEDIDKEVISKLVSPKKVKNHESIPNISVSEFNKSLNHIRAKKKAIGLRSDNQLESPMIPDNIVVFNEMNKNSSKFTINDSESQRSYTIEDMPRIMNEINVISKTSKRLPTSDKNINFQDLDDDSKSYIKSIVASSMSVTSTKSAYEEDLKYFVDGKNIVSSKVGNLKNLKKSREERIKHFKLSDPIHGSVISEISETGTTHLEFLKDILLAINDDEVDDNNDNEESSLLVEEENKNTTLENPHDEVVASPLTMKNVKGQISTSALSFGAIVDGSMQVKKIKYKNLGDPLHYEWIDSTFSNDFRVHPVRGLIKVNEEVEFDVIFEPKPQLQLIDEDIRQASLCLGINGLPPTIVSCTGICILSKAIVDLKPIEFHTSIRTSITKSIQINNTSDSAWNIFPELSNTDWTIPLDIIIMPLSSTTMDITFQPFYFEKNANPILGQLDIPLPDGTVLSYRLVGWSTPSENDILKVQGIVNVKGIYEIPITNYYDYPQEFLVELTFPHSKGILPTVIFDKVISLEGKDSLMFEIKVIPHSLGTFKGTFTFTNSVLDKYFHYDLLINCDKEEILQEFSLTSALFESMSFNLIIPNCYSSNKMIHMGSELLPSHVWWTCDSEVIRVKEITPFQGNALAEFSICYRPIHKNYKFIATLNIWTLELGCFKYHLLLDSKPSLVIPEIQFETIIGSQDIKEMSFMAFNSLKTEYSLRLLNESLFDFPKLILVDTISSWEGNKISFQLTFKPTIECNIIDKLVITSSLGIEYEISLIAKGIALDLEDLEEHVSVMEVNDPMIQEQNILLDDETSSINIIPTAINSKECDSLVDEDNSFNSPEDKNIEKLEEANDDLNDVIEDTHEIYDNEIETQDTEKYKSIEDKEEEVKESNDDEVLQIEEPHEDSHEIVHENEDKEDQMLDVELPATDISDEVKSNEVKSNEVESNEVESNEVESNEDQVQDDIDSSELLNTTSIKPLVEAIETQTDLWTEPEVSIKPIVHSIETQTDFLFEETKVLSIETKEETLTNDNSLINNSNQNNIIESPVSPTSKRDKRNKRLQSNEGGMRSYPLSPAMPDELESQILSKLTSNVKVKEDSNNIDDDHLDSKELVKNELSPMSPNRNTSSPLSKGRDSIHSSMKDIISLESPIIKPLLSQDSQSSNSKKINIFPKGFIVDKLTKSRGFQQRLLLLSGDKKRLFWRDVPSDKKKPIIFPPVTESIKLSEVKRILTSQSMTSLNFPLPQLKKTRLSLDKLDLCMTLVTDKRTVDIRCMRKQEFEDLLNTFTNLCDCN